MNQQMITIDYSRRKRTYDRVQQLIADNLPLIFLATPNVLVGAKNEVGNFDPGVLAPYALWNTEELYFKRQKVASTQ
jgi:ABC-type transport system substrate-binding protein